MGPSSLSAWCKPWVAEVYAKPGMQAVVYSYPLFVKSYLDFNVISNPFWIASYDGQNPSTDRANPT